MSYCLPQEPIFLLLFYPVLFSVSTSAPFDAHLLGRNILTALVWVSIALSYPKSSSYHESFPALLFD